MNINNLEKEFEKIKLKELSINHRFQPKHYNKSLKRHTYYDDLEKDFRQEIEIYNFSPYIQEKYSEQQKNKQILKYIKKTKENRLLNYIKQSNTNTNNSKIGKLLNKVVITNFQSNKTKKQSEDIDLSAQEELMNYLKQVKVAEQNKKDLFPNVERLNNVVAPRNEGNFKKELSVINQKIQDRRLVNLHKTSFFT